MRLPTLLAAALTGVVGCGTSTTPPDDSTAVIETVAFNVENAPTVTFNVPDMHCEYSCAPKVMETLAATTGVKDVKVDVETKTATVAIDQADFNADAAIDALVDVQFTNTTLAE